MKIIVKENYNKMSQEAAQIIIEAIRQKPNLVLGLATGSTPLGLYKELIQAYSEQGFDFSKIHSFNLDEYFGLSPENENSYHYFMERHLFIGLNVAKENIFIPDGRVELKTVKQYCRWYENKIKEKGGIDIQILGIGSNGHIGFNEPGSLFNSRTRLVNLSKQTVQDNSRFFEDIKEVPGQAITMGLGTIMEAKQIILLASGKDKAKIIEKAFSEPITEEIPASILQNHNDVIVILDKDAHYKKAN